ncbi:cyanase [Shouchella sp. 1P09AA]|uniref:cyanase n=1 Tax=unclassified Shouchella TaxID=2893065 RepID=UPI00399F627F
MEQKTYQRFQKEEATDAILLAKREKGITYDDLAAATNLHPVYIASAIMGQNTLNKEEADALVNCLELDDSISNALQLYPTKGSLDQTVPTDPLIYRFHEIVQVYGTTFKEVIQEKLGDGIMSAIDFTLDIEKEENPNGDRVVVTMNGKFLPYNKW